LIILDGKSVSQAGLLKDLGGVLYGVVAGYLRGRFQVTQAGENR
jgi:hypothetical protein